MLPLSWTCSSSPMTGVHPVHRSTAFPFACLEVEAAGVAGGGETESRCTARRLEGASALAMNREGGQVQASPLRLCGEKRLIGQGKRR